MILSPDAEVKGGAWENHVMSQPKFKSMYKAFHSTRADIWGWFGAFLTAKGKRKIVYGHVQVFSDKAATTLKGTLFLPTLGMLCKWICTWEFSCGLLPATWHWFDLSLWLWKDMRRSKYHEQMDRRLLYISSLRNMMQSLKRAGNHLVIQLCRK